MELDLRRTDDLPDAAGFLRFTASSSAVPEFNALQSATTTRLHFSVLSPCLRASVPPWFMGNSRGPEN
jgi:hypothetical protein